MGNKLNMKTLLIGLGAVVLLIALVFGGMLLLGDKGPEEIIQEITKTEDELAIEALKKIVSQEVVMGTSKEAIVQKVGAKPEQVGKNYVINPTYTRIGKYDYLTAYIFSNDALVAVVHERMLDGTQKHNLAVEFQKITSDVGELYKLINSKEEWYATPLKYDSNAWNEAITDNDLELYSEFKDDTTKEYVRVIASGINYFDFLAHDREVLSVGNLNIVYTSTAYQDDFLGFVSLAAEKE